MTVSFVVDKNVPVQAYSLLLHYCSVQFELQFVCGETCDLVLTNFTIMTFTRLDLVFPTTFIGLGRTHVDLRTYKIAEGKLY